MKIESKFFEAVAEKYFEYCGQSEVFIVQDRRAKVSIRKMKNEDGMRLINAARV